jgi:hypothetical protein
MLFAPMRQLYSKIGSMLQDLATHCSNSSMLEWLNVETVYLYAYCVLVYLV